MYLERLLRTLNSKGVLLRPTHLKAGPKYESMQSRNKSSSLTRRSFTAFAKDLRRGGPKTDAYLRQTVIHTHQPHLEMSLRCSAEIRSSSKAGNGSLSFARSLETDKRLLNCLHLQLICPVTCHSFNKSSIHEFLECATSQPSGFQWPWCSTGQRSGSQWPCMYGFRYLCSFFIYLPKTLPFGPRSIIKVFPSELGKI